MTQQESFQLKGSAPQIYEQHKVPAIFRPLAERTLRHVELQEGAQVIDIACGTGIVARFAAEKVGKPGTVIGIDLNAGMIEVARQNNPVTGPNIHVSERKLGSPFSEHAPFLSIPICPYGNLGAVI